MFKPEVVRIGHTIGESWIGEPAIYFRVLISDPAAARIAHAATKRLEGGRELQGRVEEETERVVDPLENGSFPTF